PLMRAFRVDKMTFAALHATLELFLHPQTLSATHPVTAMISLSKEKLKRRATRLAGRLKKVLPSTWNIQVEPSTSEIGGGALPDRALPTFVVALYPPPDVSPHTTARAFREQTPAVFGRVGAGCLLLDVRTMGPDDSSIVEQAATCIGVAL
ncbi:MAG: L-seryl-tRNA(Sec) selenium transferase, partial [candidate division Zixibacteria bacterium]|nr:L-seryl-tRNA(Sec) selenium transferase [candidate division Zixibacteria bacterium]